MNVKSAKKVLLGVLFLPLLMLGGGEKRAGRDINGAEKRSEQTSAQTEECPICYDVPEAPNVLVTLPCCHQKICKECINLIKDTSDENDPSHAMYKHCPICSNRLVKTEKELSELADTHLAQGVKAFFKKISSALYFFNKVLGNPQATLSAQAKAHFYLGRMYFNGLGVEKNLTKAKKHFEAVVANQQAPLDMQAASHFYVGCMYFEGLGVEKNVSEAKKRLEEVVANQQAPLDMRVESHFYVGCIYDDEKNISEAKKHFEAVVELAEKIFANKHESLTVQVVTHFYVGRIYLEGRGVEKNLYEAKRHLEAVVELSHDTTLKSEAGKLLAIVYKA
jgi:TPR repeat protein